RQAAPAARPTTAHARIANELRAGRETNVIGTELLVPDAPRKSSGWEACVTSTGVRARAHADLRTEPRAPRDLPALLRQDPGGRSLGDRGPRPRRARGAAVREARTLHSLLSLASL